MLPKKLVWQHLILLIAQPDIVSTACLQVLACEIDHEQICMAMRNCEVYGVAQGITWIHGDVFEAHLEPVDVVFLSPPWGGPGINGSTGFDATIPIQGLGRYAAAIPSLGTQQHVCTSQVANMGCLLAGA